VAITATPYGQSFIGLGMGRFDFTSHSFKVLLTTASYTPNFASDTYRSDVTNEVSGVGYVTGGQALANLSWTYDDGVAILGCDPVVCTNATFTARYAVIYRNTGTNTTSPLLSWVDFGVNVSPDNTDLPLNFINGVYRIRS